MNYEDKMRSVLNWIRESLGEKKEDFFNLLNKNKPKKQMHDLFVALANKNEKHFSYTNSDDPIRVVALYAELVTERIVREKNKSYAQARRIAYTEVTDIIKGTPA